MKTDVRVREFCRMKVSIKGAEYCTRTLASRRQLVWICPLRTACSHLASMSSADSAGSSEGESPSPLSRVVASVTSWESVGSPSVPVASSSSMRALLRREFEKAETEAYRLRFLPVVFSEELRRECLRGRRLLSRRRLRSSRIAASRSWSRDTPLSGC